MLINQKIESMIAKNPLELMLEALEMQEDISLSKIAEKVDKENAKTYSHEEAWK